MAKERVTRGQFMRFFQTAIRRGPAGLRKDWLYANLKPMVDDLEADLKESEKSPQEAAQNEPKDLPQKPEPQAQTEPAVRTEAEAVKDETAEEAAQNAADDLGDNPKSPRGKGKQNKQGNKPKEKNK